MTKYEYEFKFEKEVSIIWNFPSHLYLIEKQNIPAKTTALIFTKQKKSWLRD